VGERTGPETNTTAWCRKSLWTLCPSCCIRTCALDLQFTAGPDGRPVKQTRQTCDSRARVLCVPVTRYSKRLAQGRSPCRNPGLRFGNVAGSHPPRALFPSKVAPGPAHRPYLPIHARSPAHRSDERSQVDPHCHPRCAFHTVLRASQYCRALSAAAPGRPGPVHPERHAQSVRSKRYRRPWFHSPPFRSRAVRHQAAGGGGG
jgi:hypothetical protein